MTKLGINIDHVATLRNARGEGHPNILEIAKIVKNSGADSITVHLREDRRHIKDQDLNMAVRYDLKGRYHPQQFSYFSHVLQVLWHAMTWVDVG